MDSADLSQINLAQKLEDGQKVYIPSKGENVVFQNQSAQSSEVQKQNTATQSASGKVNINLATQEQLEELPEVGQSTAQKIIENRQSQGKFKTPEDLKRVTGIGDKKYNKLKDKICV